jgi:integrase/recombinase XerD
MKSLPLNAAHYQSLQHRFRLYLEILGYAGPTVALWPVHVRELLCYLEGRGILSISAAEGTHITAFTTHLKSRPHQRIVGTALSSSSINSILSAVAVFMRYLQHSGRQPRGWVLEREPAGVTHPTVLTIAEVRRLYESTFEPYRNSTLALGQRDRAIIAALYGCGLRRNEALQLDVTDIDLGRRRLLVRAGKGHKERYVPIAEGHAADIDRYLLEGRTWFLQRHTSDYPQKHQGRPYELKSLRGEPAFFVSEQGGRLGEFYQRLAVMTERAGLENSVTPHGLRHSIATHLLARGMDMEDIARFLGHASLASTQGYTHLINESSHADSNL